MLLRRASARFFDSGVLLLSLAVLPALLRRLGVADEQVAALTLTLGALAWWAYETVLVARWGATLGKRLLYMRVVALDGGPPSPTAAAVRAIPVFLVPVPFMWLVALAVWLSAGVVPDGRGLHDRVARTRVVQAVGRVDDEG